MGAIEVACAENARGAGTVTAVVGPVTVTRAAATPRPLKSGDLLFWRDVVESGKDGSARLVLGGKTTVTLRELSRLELRVDRQAEGIRYTVELLSGKVRASVARMLMRPGEQVEVRTRNAVASVRGTDFVVETVEPPAHAGAFGLLGVREPAPGVGDSVARSAETVVTTLSGMVEVSNRLVGAGRAEAVGAHEAVRVSGRQDSVRVRLQTADLKVSLNGLTLPRRPERADGGQAGAVNMDSEFPNVGR